MSEWLPVLAVLAVGSAGLGCLTGWLVGRVHTAAQRFGVTVVVLVLSAVVLVCLNVRAASPPPFAPVQFVIGLLTAAPAVIVAAAVAFFAVRLRASRRSALIASSVGAAIASPIVLYMAVASACALAGDCL